MSHYSKTIFFLDLVSRYFLAIFTKKFQKSFHKIKKKNVKSLPKSIIKIGQKFRSRGQKLDFLRSKFSLSKTLAKCLFSSWRSGQMAQGLSLERQGTIWPMLCFGFRSGNWVRFPQTARFFFLFFFRILKNSIKNVVEYFFPIVSNME